MSDKNMTSFCGLWCGDCIPANEKIYELTSELNHLLIETGFKNYAEFKTRRVPEFNDYDTFVKVLNAFEKLHCYGHCRQGPHSEDAGCENCKIRLCSIEKGFEGCWDCDTYSSCEHIVKMKKFHPDIMQNLANIKEHGIDNWKVYRGKHYNWS